MAYATTLQRKMEPLQPGDILVVVHDFDARSADELTLRKTERVELVELDDGFGDGWYLGRHQGREATGLFPGVYTAKLPAQLANALSSSPNKAFSNSALPIHQAPVRPFSSDASNPNQFASNFASASYQHRSSEPIALETQRTPDMPFTYGQASSYGSARNTLPSSHSNYIPAVQRSIGQALGGGHSGEESPVMNETLSVIDEHITDLSTPRQSLAPVQPLREDSESEYSSHLDRASFVAGPETDDEENGRLTQEDVLNWDHRETANHLRAIGVDPKHCDIFEEQEITGDVLMEMDQAFIYMKEYDFGVMGRRLKTWHKIRDFQNEVQGSKMSRQSSLNPAGSTDDLPRSQSRVLPGSTILPRIPSLMEKPGFPIRQSQHGHPTTDGAKVPSPLQTQQSGNTMHRSTPSSSYRASIGPDNPGRSSNAVRETSQSRRHSSIDFGRQQTYELPAGSLASTSTPHKPQSSLDREWSMGTATPTSTNATTPSLHMNTLRKQESLDMSADSPLLTEAPNLDLDRGYFSGNEIDNRKARNSLRKREISGSPVHSRQPSLLEEPQKSGPAMKRHSRLSSVDSSRDPGPLITSSAAKAYHSKYYKRRFRSASARVPVPKASSPSGLSPTVTNLETEGISPLPQARSPTAAGFAATGMNIPAKARRLMGLRAASESVTSNEKETLGSPTSATHVLEESPQASPEGSHTPSATSQSFEIDNTDTSSKGNDQIRPHLSAKASARARPKTKQQTSAYTRGLLKITPKEARHHCDYHGWMKKKSSSLITTWKPRLFILRGKRLSYYYAETDTEERGIIDISGHKVLVANSDPITTLHATITGATSTPSPVSANSSNETSPTVSKTPNSTSGGIFYFKLVPPKVGLSRAVQFTRPTIHYFQVDSAVEGRKWMGEIMKATIDHDLSSFETTNKQKTISLAKARARQERPPALKGTEGIITAVINEKTAARESGLNIQGINLQEQDGDAATATPTAESPENLRTAQDREKAPETTS